MRKIILGLTTALAFGVLAVPTVGSAASSHGVSTGTTVRSSSVKNVNTNVGVRNSAVTNNVQSWNGQQWASDGRHHRRHHRDVSFVPFAAYGDYAAYDYCWHTVWTAAGFQRIYVCGSDDYYVY